MPWQTGLVMGATAAALSLRPSGLQRGAIAQSLLATASFAAGMGVGTTIDRGLRSVASTTGADDNAVRITAGVLGLTALLAGKNLRFPFNNTIAATGAIVGVAGAAGLGVDLHREVSGKLARAADTSHFNATTALAATEAVLLTGYLLYRRRINAAHDITTPTVKAVLAATGSVTGTTLGVGAYQTATEDKSLPVARWTRNGLVTATAVGAGAGALLLAKKKLGPSPPPAQLTTTLRTVAGHPGSLVDVTKLSRDAVKYLDTVTPAAEIQKVMGEKAVDPIRVVVGLKSAQTPAARADLALRELDRLGTFGGKGLRPRKYIFVTVPPGAGKVDPPLMQSAEYMSRGDIASVALQYSDRPSALSLNRVDKGAETYRAFFDGLGKRIGKLPEAERPKVLVYGNSLGAWVSQETAAGRGVAGLEHIDRALWVGTPGPSGWFRQMLFSKDPRFAADRAQVLQFSTVEQLERLAKTPDFAEKRFFLHTRASDPVPKIDVDMLWRRPHWLRADFREAAGTPRHSFYTPVVSFFQTLTDIVITTRISDDPTKAALGHTYHSDIVPDVRHALFPGAVSDRQVSAIRKVLDGTPPVH